MCCYSAPRLPCSFTEAETSDEEFVANHDEEDGKESDACSDLDEEEEEEEEKEGCDVGGDSADESSDRFSDDEDLQTFTRLSRKAPRMLDSDDEATGSVESERTSDDVPPPAVGCDAGSGSSVAGLGENKETVGDERTTRNDVTNKRRTSVLLNPEEASMGPLVFNTSFESEESNSVDSLEAKMETSNGNGSCGSRDPLVALAGPASLGTIPPSREPHTQATSSRPKSKIIEEPACSSLPSVTAGPPDDSGVGGSLEEDSRTQSVKHEENSVMVADSSLEMSFHWEQSLPPAQPRRNDSLELFTVAGTDSLGSSSLPEKVSWWRVRGGGGGESVGPSQTDIFCVSLVEASGTNGILSGTCSCVNCVFLYVQMI